MMMKVASKLCHREGSRANPSKRKVKAAERKGKVHVHVHEEVASRARYQCDLRCLA